MATATESARVSTYHAASQSAGEARSKTAAMLLSVDHDVDRLIFRLHFESQRSFG